MTDVGMKIAVERHTDCVGSEPSTLNNDPWIIHELNEHDEYNLYTEPKSPA